MEVTVDTQYSVHTTFATKYSSTAAKCSYRGVSGMTAAADPLACLSALKIGLPANGRCNRDGGWANVGFQPLNSKSASSALGQPLQICALMRLSYRINVPGHQNP
jgi:hypothetical protein